MAAGALHGRHALVAQGGAYRYRTNLPTKEPRIWVGCGYLQSSLGPDLTRGSWRAVCLGGGSNAHAPLSARSNGHNRATGAP
jgi:hypothetical protein